MLPFDTAGKPTGREQLPLIDYCFEPATLTVELMKTTMGDVIATEESRSSPMLSQFGATEPEALWQGKVVNLAEAERVEETKLRGPARNGSGRRP